MDGYTALESRSVGRDTIYAFIVYRDAMEKMVYANKINLLPYLTKEVNVLVTELQVQCLWVHHRHVCVPQTAFLVAPRT